MALTQKNQLAIAIKKSVGKGHTNSQFGPENESIGSYEQIGPNKIFGETINSTVTYATSTADTNLFKTGSDGVTQFTRFTLQRLTDGLYTPAAGASATLTIEDDYNTAGGYTPSVNYHAYMAKLTGSYVSDTTAINTFTGLGSSPYVNNAAATGSDGIPLGQLQIIPPTFGSDYTLTLRDSSQNSINPLSGLNWYFDYSNGILFVQDDHVGVGVNEPAFVDAYIYIGKSLETKLTELSAGSGGGGSGVGWSKSSTVLFTSESYSQVQITGSLLVSGSNVNLNVAGPITGSFISASSGFVGDGKQLTNVTASYIAPGAVTILKNGSTAIEALSDRLFASSSLVVSGSGITFAVSGTIETQYATFTSSLLPTDNQQQDLGSNSKQWNKAWIKSGSFTDISVTTISGNTATFNTVNVTTLNQTTTTNLNISASFVTLSSGSNSLQASNGLLVQKSTSGTGVADGLIYAVPENTGIYGATNRWAFSSSIAMGTAQTSQARNILPFMQIQTAAFTGTESPVLGKGDFLMVSGSGGATDGLYIYF
jgi:hypothetical protein